MRGLFISGFNFIENCDTGGSQISKRNFSVLKELYGDEIELIMPFKNDYSVSNCIHYFKSNERKIGKIMSILLSYSLHQIYSRDSIKSIRNYIYNNHFDFIWFDGYFLGKLIKLSRSCSNKILFMHNIETKLAWDIWNKWKVWQGVHFLSVKLLEKQAVKYADRIININSRDAVMLKHIFFKTPDMVFPVTLEDRFKSCEQQVYDNDMIDDYILFVGSYYIPNIDGLKWIKKYVIDYIDCKLYVVGKGMEKIKDQIQSEKLIIIGTVEDITPYYANANAVIEPIFSGGGMKVKTAEALMYGKCIIATEEALTGYEDIKDIEGIYVCKDAEEFISAIQCVTKQKVKYNKYIRNAFVWNYTNEKYKTKINEVCLGENKYNIT